MLSLGDWYCIVNERPLAYALPGLLASGEAEPAGGKAGLLSVMGETWLINESLRFKAEPLAVWRSLWRLHKSSRTKVL